MQKEKEQNIKRKKRKWQIEGIKQKDKERKILIRLTNAERKGTQTEIERKENGN